MNLFEHVLVLAVLRRAIRILPIDWWEQLREDAQFEAKGWIQYIEYRMAYYFFIFTRQFYVFYMF